MAFLRLQAAVVGLVLALGLGLAPTVAASIPDTQGIADDLRSRLSEPRPELDVSEPESVAGDGASLPETRVRGFRLFDPFSRPGYNGVSRANATRSTFGLWGTRVGPVQKGLWTDPVTGVAYARARWYDARNGVFLTEDPMEDIDSPNRYAFVGWAPSMNIDPLGEESIREWFDVEGDRAEGKYMRAGVKNLTYMAWNVLTFGFLGRHDEDFEETGGWHGDRDAYVGETAQNLGRTGVEGTLSLATGGLAGAGAKTVSGAMMRGAVGGAGSGLVTTAAVDVYERSTGGEAMTGEDYLHGAAGGAFFGAIGGGLGKRVVDRTKQTPHKVADLGGAMGETDKFGNITIDRGLTGKDFIETLRHESVHRFFSPREPGLLQNFRANLGWAAYERSSLVRYLEEVMAESYATKSLMRGVRFPVRNGYVTVGRTLMEAGLYGGATAGGAYVAYEIGNDP